MTGWGVMGCLLEQSSLLNWESGSLLAMIRGAFGNGYKGAQSALQVILVLGSASVAVAQGFSPMAWGRTQHRRTANEQVIQSLG